MRADWGEGTHPFTGRPRRGAVKKPRMEKAKSGKAFCAKTCRDASFFHRKKRDKKTPLFGPFFQAR